MGSKQLIEDAAKAYANDLATSPEHVKDRPDSSHVTPTDDEREALARAIYSKIAFRGGDDEHYEAMRGSMYHEAADAVIALGFHRTVQGEPSDAQIEAACLAYAADEMTRDEWEWLKTQPESFQPYWDGMKAALIAAAETV